MMKPLTASVQKSGSSPPSKQGGVSQAHLVGVNPVPSRVTLDSKKTKVCNFFWWDDAGASGFTVV